MIHQILIFLFILIDSNILSTQQLFFTTNVMVYGRYLL